MAQAGIHSIVGMAVRKWIPDREWLMLGVVLGNLLPDADNLAVAVATVAKLPTEGPHLHPQPLHRRPGHKASPLGQPGVGIGHRGADAHPARPAGPVQRGGDPVADPIVGEPVERRHPARVVEHADDAGRVSVFRPLFVLLDVTARKRGTDGDFSRTLRVWTVVQGVLFAAYTVLVYTMEKGFMVPFEVLYLLSLGLAFGVTLRMQETVEAVVQ